MTHRFAMRMVCIMNRDIGRSHPVCRLTHAEGMSLLGEGHSHLCAMYCIRQPNPPRILR